MPARHPLPAATGCGVALEVAVARAPTTGAAGSAEFLWRSEDPKICAATVLTAAEQPDVQPLAVAKDYWVCQALRAVAVVHRICAVIAAVDEAGARGVSVSRLAAQLQEPQPDVAQIVGTLEREGYVARRARVSSGPALWGMRPQHLDALRARARHEMRLLADEFNESITLGVLEGDGVRCIEATEPDRSSWRLARRGQRAPLHATA